MTKLQFYWQPCKHRVKECADELIQEYESKYPRSHYELSINFTSSGASNAMHSAKCTQLTTAKGREVQETVDEITSTGIEWDSFGGKNIAGQM